MPNLESVTYEESRLEYFQSQKEHCERCLQYWVKAQLKGKRGYSHRTIIQKCHEYAAMANYYKDAIDAFDRKMDNDLIKRSDLIKTINSVVPEFVVKGEITSYEVYDTIIALIDVAPAVNA